MLFADLFQKGSNSAYFKKSRKVLLGCGFFFLSQILFAATPTSLLIPRNYTPTTANYSENCTAVFTNGTTPASSTTPLQMDNNNGGLNYYTVPYSGYYTYKADCNWESTAPPSAFPLMLWMDAWATTNNFNPYPTFSTTPTSLDVRLLYSGEAPLQLQTQYTPANPYYYNFQLHGGAFLNKNASVWLPRVWTDSNDTANIWIVTCKVDVYLVNKS